MMMLRARARVCAFRQVVVGGGMCFNKFVGGRLGGQQPVAWLLPVSPHVVCVCGVVCRETHQGSDAGLMQLYSSPMLLVGSA